MRRLLSVVPVTGLLALAGCVVAPPTGLTPAPESTTTAPPKSEDTKASDSGSSGTGSSGTGSTPAAEKATAHLLGGVKLSKGKLLATVECTGTGTCSLLVSSSPRRPSRIRFELNSAQATSSTKKGTPCVRSCKASASDGAGAPPRA